MTSLTRRYGFSASHRLHSDRLTPDENRAVFGKCNNPFGHGHNYHLEVTVLGEIDPRTGLVASREALDACVRRAVLSRLDHRDLNTGVPELAALVPTTENLGLQIGRWLAQEWRQLPPGGQLSRIRLEETGSNTIEIRFP